MKERSKDFYVICVLISRMLKRASLYPIVMSVPLYLLYQISKSTVIAYILGVVFFIGMLLVILGCVIELLGIAVDTIAEKSFNKCNS